MNDLLKELSEIRNPEKAKKRIQRYVNTRIMEDNEGLAPTLVDLIEEAAPALRRAIIAHWVINAVHFGTRGKNWQELQKYTEAIEAHIYNTYNHVMERLKVVRVLYNLATQENSLYDEASAVLRDLFYLTRGVDDEDAFDCIWQDAIEIYNDYMN